MRVPAYLLLALWPVTVLAQNAGPDSKLLYYSITAWTNSTSPAENGTYAMTHREVQRLLLDIAESPRKRDYVEKALAGSGVSLSDMVANGSLRLEGGRYWLNFSLLTRSGRLFGVQQIDILRVLPTLCWSDGPRLNRS